MKILIVDDHQIIHEGLKRTLSDEFPGTTFGNALQAQRALELLQSVHWDLVILDIDLPGRGGIEVLTDARRLYPKLPILIFSMHSEDQFAVRVLRAGASGYVPKDGPSSQLMAAVHRVLEGGKYISAAVGERLAADLGKRYPSVLHERLSDREFEVMRMLASGKSTTEIADLLSLSVKTVSTYRTRVLDKLHLSTSSEMIRYAIQHELDR